MGKASLANQGQQAIISCIAIGQSKRTDRYQTGGTDWKIFGVNYLKDLKSTNQDLMSYIRAQYPGCRYIRDVKPEMLQAWLQAKADKGVSQEYIGKLTSHLRKLEKCYRHKYSGINLHLDQVDIPCQIDDKQRDKVMDDGTYTKILDAMPRGKSQAWKSVVLSHSLGLRINETANLHADHIRLVGGRWGYGQVVVQGRQDGAKGGRWRTVDILSADDRKAVQECLEGVQPGGLVISKADGSAYKTDSLQRAIDRAMDKAGIGEITDWRQNKNHALRKNFAQRCYDIIRRQPGGTVKAAEGYANEQLGHSANRRGLTVVYIANRW